jgi:hypothetical protein
MRTPLLRVLSIVLLMLTVSKAYSQPLSGTLSIGPAPSNYTTLALAFTDLATKGVSGPVILELKSNYVSEASTIRPTPIPGSSTNNTVTVRPVLGSPTITISMSNSVFLLDNVDNLIIDGRPGGVGTTRGLYLQSTSNGTPVIYQFGDVQNVTIKYCTFKAINDNSSSGMLVLSSSGITDGADNWTISNCDFNCLGSNNAIYVTASASGTTDNLVITNNIIHDLYSATNASFTHNGIYVISNVTSATITNNSIYNTAAYLGEGFYNPSF